MISLDYIYGQIAEEGFSEATIGLISNHIEDIRNGRTDFPRFSQPEHAGLCTAGAPLIGASIIAGYASASLAAGGHASGCQNGGANNRQIDSLQERLIEQWARAAHLWIDNSEQIIIRYFGPLIAQGAESKVYYRAGDTSVVKERVSIYSTTQKALDAIVLHNYLFPETAMHVIGFTRDGDGLMRIVLTQPYVRCLRLATKTEIDELAARKGFRDNRSGQGVNYISDRIALEDMHPANVFIDEVGEQATCIDCIVKFI